MSLSMNQNVIPQPLNKRARTRALFILPPYAPTLLSLRHLTHLDEFLLRFGFDISLSPDPHAHRPSLHEGRFFVHASYALFSCYDHHEAIMHALKTLR